MTVYISGGMMNNKNCRKRKGTSNQLFDLNKFDEWYEMTYRPGIYGGHTIPKVITFKEHIRILKERDNDYTRLLNCYNELVDAFNNLQKAFCEAAGERYYEEVKK